MSPEDLLAKLATEYGIVGHEAIPLDLGCDAASTPFRVLDESGVPHFVKIRRGVDRMPILSIELFEQGIEEVLAPTRSLSGTAWTQLPDGILLVYPWLDGKSGFSKPLEPQHWRRLGAALRRVHDSGKGSDLPVEPFAVADIESLQAQVEKPPPQLAKTIRRHQAAMNRIIDRAQDLGKACAARDWPLVPCHADIHVGNVVTDHFDGLHIIDWDAPRLAPRECDLLFMCDGGTWGGHGKNEEAAFFQGYGGYEPSLLLLTYYRYARALEDLVSFGREAVDPASTEVERAEAARWFAVQLESGQIVDIAMASDRRLTSQP